jgi:hypothetical protein
MNAYSYQSDKGDKPSDILTAARKLADGYYLRVIIDCSDDTLPKVLNGREINFEIEPMSNELMQQLISFTELIKELEEYQALDVVLAVCGGRPRELKNLQDELDLITPEQKKDQMSEQKKAIEKSKLSL